MKKVLIILIFLIPIIVLLTITATGSLIAASTTVLPTNIVVKDRQNIPIGERTINVDLTDQDLFLIVEIVPTIISDDGITYELDGVEGATGSLRLERIEKTNRYKIIPETAGAARVIIRSVLDYNVSRKIIFYITTDKVSSVSLYNSEGSVLGASLEIYSPVKLGADVLPAEAFASSEWYSDNETAVKVDLNGTIRPISKGVGTVWFEVTDKSGAKILTPLVVDTTKALVNSSVVYKTGAAADINYIKEKVVIDSEATVTYSGSGKFTVSKGDRSATVTAYACSEGDWGFSDGLGRIYTNNGNYFLETEYLTGGKVNATFSSDNPAVAYTEGNRLIPVSAGIAKITALGAGGKREKTVTVRERPFVFDLELNAEDARRGIRLDRIFAGNFYSKDGGLINTYQFGAESAKGGSAESYDLVWSSDDPSLASVDENALITFYPASAGKEVKITAAAAVGNYLTAVRRSFTFKISADTSAVNVYDLSQLAAITSNGDHAIVLQADMYPTSGITLRNSIYGNGFTLFGSAMESGADTETVLLEIRDLNPTLAEIRIVDFAVQGTSAWTPEKPRFRGFYACDIQIPITFANLVLKNCMRGLDIRRCKTVTIEGSILGDNYQATMNLMYNPPVDADLVLRNNVMKYSEGPAVVICLCDFGTDNYGKNILPRMSVEGFFEIYNWKRADQLSTVLRSLGIENMNTSKVIDPKQLARAISDVFAGLMTTPEMAGLFYSADDGYKYLSLGIFILGAMNIVDTSRLSLTADGVALKEMPLSGVSGNAGMIIDLLNAITTSQGIPIGNSCYIVGYEFKGREPAYKPGAPIPQTLELYRRLNGYYDGDRE